MILSNLSASSVICASLIALKISIIKDPSSSIGYYATQSRCSTCIAPEPYPSGRPQDVAALPLLLDAFVQAAQTDSSRQSRKGSLHFLASVFANLSAVRQIYAEYSLSHTAIHQVPAGRAFFLTPQSTKVFEPSSESEYPLASVVAFTEHSDKIRRAGVASIIK
jgi:hypothetical protein